MCFQPNRDLALLLQFSELPFDDSPHPMITHPDGDESTAPFISISGINLYNSRAYLWLPITGSSSAGDARKYDKELVLDGEAYSMKLSWHFGEENDIIYLKDDAGYLGSKDESLCFYDNPLQTLTKLVPINLPTVFFLADDADYYTINFIKTSYGLTMRSDTTYKPS